MNTVETVLHWASTTTWRGTPAIIHEITDRYDRGVRIARSAFRPIADRLTRCPKLPKWSLTIQPNELVQYFPADAQPGGAGTKQVVRRQRSEVRKATNSTDL